MCAAKALTLANFNGSREKAVSRLALRSPLRARDGRGGRGANELLREQTHTITH